MTREWNAFQVVWALCTVFLAAAIVPIATVALQQAGAITSTSAVWTARAAFTAASFALTAAPVVIVLLMARHMHHRSRRGGGLCPACGYPLAGLPTDICPECGQSTAQRDSGLA